MCRRGFQNQFRWSIFSYQLPNRSLPENLRFQWGSTDPKPEDASLFCKKMGLFGGIEREFAAFLAEKPSHGRLIKASPCTNTVRKGQK